MTVVFIGGSRAITSIPPPVVARIEKMTAFGYRVLVGDANGADKAVQAHLAAGGYSNVTVYCSGGECRNNVGGWPVVAIEPSSKKRDFQFFAAKDRALAYAATIGLMLWDGESAGTIMNVKRLVALGKTAVVFQAPEGRFLNVRDASDLRDLLATVSPKLAAKIADEAAAEAHPELFKGASSATRRPRKPHERQRA